MTVFVRTKLQFFMKVIEKKLALYSPPQATTLGFLKISYS